MRFWDSSAIVPLIITETSTEGLLAAAVTASERLPASLTVVTLDERLASAARREGFTVQGVDPAS